MIVALSQLNSTVGDLAGNAALIKDIVRQSKREADILVAALGSPNAVTRDMVKLGSIVIDVGINRVDDSSTDKGYRLVGDVDFKAVSSVAGAITPVPGGVGPMTIAMLISNTYQAAKLAAEQLH